MGHKATRPIILKYLSNFPGEDVFLADLVKATKLQPDQVKSAMLNIKYANARGDIDFPLETIQAGQIWRHTPEQAANSAANNGSNKTKYEELGITKTGDLIIQDEAGKLYRATEL